MSSLSTPTVEISPRAAKRLRAGHVWIYRSDVLCAEGAAPGDVVQVKLANREGGTHLMGLAFYNPASLITLRLITREARQPDRALWAGLVDRALSLRPDRAKPALAQRLIYAEADELPGLIVDRYGGALVLQTLSAGADRLRDLWVELLVERLVPKVVVERNDVSSRKLEGLEERRGILRGSLSGPIEIQEGELRYLVDPLEGQKTGFYLDQRENRLQAARYARGRCLDVFSYQGGFGLQLKKAGAERVTLVDVSEKALHLAGEAARLNQLEIELREENAFDFLRAQAADGERYDVIVLDPPAFTKNKDAVDQAVRGYKELNLRAMRLLTEGGILITSSCSYHMSAQLFEDMLLEASLDVHRTVQVLERRSQAVDHPERLGFPESRYLKCYVLRVI